MEILDIFLIAIGALTVYEGALRLDMIRKADDFRKTFERAEESGNHENSVSYKIMMKPIMQSSWNPGIGDWLNDKPILIAVAIIIVLALAGQAIGLAIVYSKLAIVFLGGIFAIALHSGPDRLNIEEHYLQNIVNEDPTELNGHDQKYMNTSISEFRGWSRMQVLFGVCILIAAILPPWLLLADSLLIVLIGLIYLGSKYSIQKGVFGQVPRI